MEIEPSILLHTGNAPQYQRQTLPQNKGLENIFQENFHRKQAGVAILISYKINFRPRVIKKYKEGHSILIKGKIYQEKLLILNIYAPNGRLLKFLKETLLKLK